LGKIIKEIKYVLSQNYFAFPIFLLHLYIEPIPKDTLLLTVGNSQSCFHDHELD